MLNDVKLLQRTKNTESLGQCKSRFSLFVEQILVFVSSNKLLREVKKDSPKLKQIV